MVMLRKGTQIILGEMKKMLVIKGDLKAKFDTNVIEKIVESEDEEEEEEEVPKTAVNKKSETKQKKKVESDEEEEEVPRNIKHKERTAKSKEPRVNKIESKSRSRSRR